MMANLTSDFETSSESDLDLSGDGEPQETFHGVLGYQFEPKKKLTNAPESDIDPSLVTTVTTTDQQNESRPMRVGNTNWLVFILIISLLISSNNHIADQFIIIQPLFVCLST